MKMMRLQKASLKIFMLMLASREDHILREDLGYGPGSVMLLFRRETRVERPKLVGFHGLIAMKRDAATIFGSRSSHLFVMLLLYRQFSFTYNVPDGVCDLVTLACFVFRLLRNKY